MFRYFLPVGQGAFYYEKFYSKEGSHTIVYDCGSLTKGLIVKKRIEDEFEKGESIAAVFISHFDEDHINGLPFLLEYCKVEKLFFPLITDKDKIYSKLQALLSTDKRGFLYTFIDNPYTAIDDLNLNYTPTLYQVKTLNDNDISNVNAEHISSGHNVMNYLNLDEYIGWELVPFNFRQNERIEEFKKAIAKTFDCRIDLVEEKITEIINNYPNDKSKIKEAYEQVKGSLNTNSMTLFSGIKKANVIQYCSTHKRSYHSCVCHPQGGCLYMGDYDASGPKKWKDLKGAYKEYWNYIGCVQIPHHGSKYNYNNEIAKLYAFNIISAGCKHKHPHWPVIKDLIVNDCFVHIVTEDTESKISIRVDLF